MLLELGSQRQLDTFTFCNDVLCEGCCLLEKDERRMLVLFSGVCVRAVTRVRAQMKYRHPHPPRPVCINVSEEVEY